MEAELEHAKVTCLRTAKIWIETGLKGKGNKATSPDVGKKGGAGG